MYEIYNEDCLEGMKRIESGSVDAIICDPPFGITNCAFDKRLPFEPMWEQFKRVTKRNAAIVLFSQMPFGSDLIQSNKKMFRYEWVWRKPMPAGFLNAKKMPLRCHENILVFYRQLPTYNPQFTQGEPYNKRQKKWTAKNYSKGIYQGGINDTGERYPRDEFIFKNGDNANSLHPTQKPVPLLEYLIRTYTNEGETVLDATMGSGSTGVAAINTGRKFIGFELEKNFYDIAKKRIDEAIAKRAQSLF